MQNDDELFNEVAGDYEGDADASAADELDPEQEQEQTGDDDTGGEADAPGSDEQTSADPEQQPGETLEELRERLARAEQEAQQWQHRYKSNEGRVAAYQRQVEELRQSTAKQSAQGGEPSRQDAVDALQQGRWGQFKEEFPEFAEAVEEMMSQRVGSFEEQLRPLQETAQTIQFRESAEALSAAHPDWMQIDGSAEFHGWLAGQPEEIQGMYGKGPQKAAYLISAYKKDAGIAQQSGQGPSQNEAERLRQKRQKQLERSSIPTSQRGAGLSLDADQSSDDALFNSIARQFERKQNRF